MFVVLVLPSYLATQTRRRGVRLRGGVVLDTGSVCGWQLVGKLRQTIASVILHDQLVMLSQFNVTYW